MTTRVDARAMRVAARKASQDGNLFGRLSASAIASRGQAQRLLTAGPGLSITEWRILWDLAEAGPLSIQDMATIQRTDHSLISRALPAMRQKGIVETTRNTEDKRQSLVMLTAQGRAVYDSAAPIMQLRRDTLAQTFTPQEMRSLLGLLDRFDAFLTQPLAPLPSPQDAP
ncbi:MAG: MarR family transcriptional regulator [Pseudomonadota bacterium]